MRLYALKPKAHSASQPVASKVKFHSKTKDQQEKIERDTNQLAKQAITSSLELAKEKPINLPIVNVEKENQPDLLNVMSSPPAKVDPKIDSLVKTFTKFLERPKGRITPTQLNFEQEGKNK